MKASKLKKISTRARKKGLRRIVKGCKSIAKMGGEKATFRIDNFDWFALEHCEKTLRKLGFAVTYEILCATAELYVSWGHKRD